MRKNNLAYICSPYRGNILEKARNILYAKRLTKLALQLGYTPIIDELATETCECVNARIYTHKKSQKERAHNKIDLLFGENNTTVIVPDAAVDLLHKTVYPICEGFIQSATVDMGNGIKGKISITTKGIIKVTRTKTNTSTYEA